MESCAISETQVLCRGGFSVNQRVFSINSDSPNNVTELFHNIVVVQWWYRVYRSSLKTSRSESSILVGRRKEPADEQCR